MQEREADNSSSSSKARGKGKSKEEDGNKIGNPENNENEYAVIDRQTDVLNMRKGKLQATELLNKVEEVRKSIDDLAKAVSASEISLPAGREEDHGRSGVGSAGERSKTETRKPAPNRRSIFSPEVVSRGQRRADSGTRHATNQGRPLGYESYSSRPFGW